MNVRAAPLTTAALNDLASKNTGKAQAAPKAAETRSPNKPQNRW